MARGVLIVLSALLRNVVTMGGAVIVLCASPAHAQEPPVTPAPPVVEAPVTNPEPPAETLAPATQEKKKDKKKKKKKKALAFRGRVFVRGAIDKTADEPDWLGHGTIDNARARADYRGHGLHAALSIEFAGKPRIKNAYVQLRAVDGEPRLDLRAGQFKMPLSAIELESRWTLPVADRGLLHTVLVNRLQVAGRSVGAAATLTLKHVAGTRIEAGVFQGTDDAGNPLEASAHDRFGQDAVLRLSTEPVRGLAIGASGQARVGALNIDAPPIIRRAYAGELDATFEALAGPGTVRAWAEAMVGTSWISGRMVPCSGARSCKALFREGRAIAAYRVGGATRREPYAEVYGQGGALDPDSDITDDLVVELAGGLTYGAWDFWRVQLEAQAWRFGANAPLGIAAFAIVPVDDTRILLQLGARI